MMSHDLAELLLSQPNMTVVLSSDEEGNSFNTLADYSIELIEKDGDSYELDLFNKEELLSDGDYTEDEITAAFKDALVLWP